VTLYWANHDQYYIKTGENFTDYTWKAPNGVTVHFKLTAADVEQNNVKGDKRFFLPCLDEIAWDESAKILTIPFEFRPLNGQEAITYGGKNQQEAIIAKAVENIPKHRIVKTASLALAALEAVKRRTGDGESVTHLEHHLRQYTRRNTSDFFIHKDLKGFLSRELDFYLKNEVFNLEEMEAAGVGLSEGWFQMMRLIKKVGGHIIEFLAQIEEFQKMLWEKRKFITETFYCITVGPIPEEFYPEIAACEAQWAEWKALFSIDEGKSVKNRKDRRIEVLKAHPTLVLDTRHYSPDPSTGAGQSFTDRLLASFDDLDEAIDGLLVHGENWQVLNLLIEKYREQVKCVYIDPPYNTDASAILYKNDYKNSSWLALMYNRLNAARMMLDSSGILCAAIDDEEASELKHMLSTIFARELGIVAVRSNPAGRKTKGKFAPAHEYAMFHGMSSESIPMSLDLTEKRLARYPHQDELGRYAWANFIRSGSGDKREDRPTMFYPIYVSSDNKIRIPKMEYDDEKQEYSILEEPKATESVVYPILKNGPSVVEKRWHRGHERVMKELYEYLVRRTTEGISIDFKARMDEDSLPTTWWDAKEYASANYGAAELKALFGEKNFDFAKSCSLVRDCILASGGRLSQSLILDFFAGSGTSGHAVINLNREDGGRRKFILVEMAQYFDTVLLPRIKKVTFSPEWKDGKPKRMATAEEAERSPRIVKVIRLESYEDALNNIAFDEPSGQQAMQFEDYLLQYMLRWETRKSETLLNVETLAKPFSYQLHIHRDGATRAQAVDLPETFAYLLGLYVRKRQALNDNDRRYLVYRGTTREGRKAAVIWRETEGWKEKDYKRDKEFVAAQKLTEGMDEVYVNGDSYIPGARALEPLFKERMFAPVEV
jgi:adenine-specific DNA-methyltransferase